MLAPENMLSFNYDWNPIGPKSQLKQLISEASNISPTHLDSENFRTASTAAKMSWMAKRITTEEEDIAYCLLGTFDVNMIPCYGEGRKAFLRLQETIISSRIGDLDESIFAWKSNAYETSGLLAPWPDCFEKSGNILFMPERTVYPKPAKKMTSQGLQLDTPGSSFFNCEYHPTIYYFTHKRTMKIDLPIQCWVKDKEKNLRAVTVHLERNRGSYRRIKCNELGTCKNLKIKSSLIVEVSVSIPQVEKTVEHASRNRHPDSDLVRS